MAKLRVTIIDEVRNRRLKVDLPDDAAMEKLLPALAKKLGLPPAGYRLTHETTRRALGGDQTLASSGVGEGDALRLAAEKAVPLWQKVPVWAWGAIGGVVLLIAVAGAFVAGRGAKLVPTPPVVAEVTTPAVRSTAVPQPTATPVAPTSTPLLPTDTPVLPTATPVPPTDTPVPTLTPVLPTPTSAPEAAPIPADSWGQVVVPPGEKVQIALVTDFSTEWADVGADQRNAGQMAVEDAGPIKDFPVDLVNVDGGCSSEQPVKAQGAANTIVLNPSMVGIVGHSCSESCNPAAPIYEEAHVVMIISGCSDSTLSEHGYKVFNRTTLHGLEEAMAQNEQVERSSSYQAFMSRYQARYGAPPAQGPNPEYHLGVISAYTYDAMAILIQAIEQVAAVDEAGNLIIGRQALANTVRATSGYQGVTGVISFDSKGDRLP